MFSEIWQITLEFNFRHHFFVNKEQISMGQEGGFVASGCDERRVRTRQKSHQVAMAKSFAKKRA
jgi:hypothetical protein